MKKIKKGIRSLLLIVMIAGLGGVFSCSSSSSSSSSDETEGVSYKGNSTIVSSVTVASAYLGEAGLTASGRVISQKEINGRKILQNVESPTALEGAEVTLSAVKTDGSLEDTGFTGVVDANGDVTISGIKDDQLYKIKVKKPGSSGDIELQAAVNVAKDDTSVSVEVNERTAYISELILKALPDQTELKAMPEVYYDALVQVVTNVFVDLLESGDIILASPVIKSDQDRTAWTEQVDEGVNVLENAEGVENKLEETQDVIVLESDSRDLRSAKKVVRRLFSVYMEGDGGGQIPEFFVENFAQAWVNDVQITLPEFAEGYVGSLQTAHLTQEERTTLLGYFTESRVQALFEHIVTAGYVQDIYRSHNNQSTTEQIPTIARLVFPAGEESKWTGEITSTTKMNVPQSILVLLQEETLMNGQNLPENLQGLIGNEGPPFDPIKFVSSIGFTSIEDGKSYIVDKRLLVQTFRSHDNQGGRGQKEKVIESEIRVYRTETALPISKVELEYPNDSGATSKVNYVKRSYQHGQGDGPQERRFDQEDSDIGKEVEYRISPWEYDGATAVKVTDFVAGEATIRVYDENNVVVDTDTATIVDLDLGSVRFVYPESGRSKPVPTTEIDGEHIADITISWREPTGNLDTTKYGLRYELMVQYVAQKRDHQGQNPSFPSVVDNAYSEDTGWDESHGDFSRRERIYDSWKRVNGEEKDHIRGKSLRLLDRNIVLKETESNIEDNYITQYEIGIGAMVINKATKAEVYRAGHDHTHFTVGDAGTWNLALQGTVTFERSPEELLRDHNFVSANGTVSAGTWKVGLMKREKWDQGQPQNFFFKSGDNTVTPVMNGSTKIMATLGTNSQITQGESVSFSFPSFSQTDSVLERDTNYAIIVWYDLDEPVSNQNNYRASLWSQYRSGEGPVTDAFDTYNYTDLEFFREEADIREDFQGVRYHNWKAGIHDEVLSDKATDNQTIEITLEY